jgi:N-acetylneuraminic acid mutarotase
MKTKLFLLQLCRCGAIGMTLISFWGSSRLQAQTPGDWTWVSGGNTTNNPSVYGTRATPAASNMIGARYGQSGGAGSSPYFWIFGGTDGYGNSFNDFWTYVPSTGIWTWIKGNNTPNGAGIYGTRGVAAVGNTPGARYAQSGWTDQSGMIWIFGGYGYDADGNLGYLNDLWEFNPGSSAWTWVSGSSTANSSGVYGTQGTAAAGNAPGGRYYQSGWMDASGNFWIFGGNGLATSGGGYLNDLWKYNPSTGLWTWISGNSAASQPGSYGTQGIAAASNMPSGRYAQGGAADASGNFWVFGGRNTSGLMNDLWKYNPSTGLWTWVSGSSSANSAGVYGTQGVAASSNVPGARVVNIWTDASGNIWTFGGGGYDVSGTNGVMNDLWEYSPSAGQWTWVDGSNTVNSTGSYGTKGTATTSNQPPSRQVDAGWVDAAGNFWVMGGISNAGPTYNDLWEYSPVEVLALQGLTLQGILKGNENILTWQSINEINTAGFVVERSTDGISFSGIGNVTATGTGNNSYSFTDAHPPVQGNVFYRLKEEDRMGNVSWSSVVELTRTANSNISVFPNPAVSAVMLQINGGSLLNTPARLLDAGGRTISQQMITGQQQYFDLQGLAGGIYFLQLADGTTIKILKQ